MIYKFFKFIIILFLIVILTMIIINIFMNSPYRITNRIKGNIVSVDCINCSHQDWLWLDGRNFKFDVIYMNLFSVGSAQMNIKSDKYKRVPVYILSAALEPDKLFNKIFNSNMLIKSTIDINSKLPYLYQESITTSEKTKLKKIIFKPEDRIAEREGLKFRISDKTHDPLSIFFNLLSSDFKIGETIVLNLFSKEEIYEFKVTPVELKDNIYKIVGEVYRQDKSSSHGAKFTIWVLNDEVRVPLLVKVISAAGPIYLRLKDLK